MVYGRTFSFFDYLFLLLAGDHNFLVDFENPLMYFGSSSFKVDTSSMRARLLGGTKKAIWPSGISRILGSHAFSAFLIYIYFPFPQPPS